MIKIFNICSFHGLTRKVETELYVFLASGRSRNRAACMKDSSFRPANLASLGKRSIVTMFVHVAETMKGIFVSLSRYWRKRYLNYGN